MDAPALAPRPPFDPIGVHRQSAGDAVGIGLPFGHSDSENLSKLIDAARHAGAAGLRASPGRALLLMNVTSRATTKLITEAAALGFIVDPVDPRRKVVACAGAPICASGQIASRAMAPAVAEAARSLPAGDIIHLSGCVKGCAHPSPAPLAVIGRDGCCDVFVDGALSCSVTPDELPVTIAERVRLQGKSR